MATTNTAPELKSWDWIDELSAETGIPVRTFRHWRLTGKGGPPSFLIGRRIAYDRAEVRKWIAQQRAARD
jgi:predicted DNA-binding transcriptional regulator AlpA